MIVASALVDALGPGRPRRRPAWPRSSASLRRAAYAAAREPRRRDGSPSRSRRRRRRRSRPPLDWPGWSRSGKTEELALEALVAYAAALRPVAEAGRRGVPEPRRALDIDVVERRRAAAGPSSASRAASREQDRRPRRRGRSDRLAALVEAAWTTFDRIVGGRARELRKGPRGGGRDTSKMVDHVVGVRRRPMPARWASRSPERRRSTAAVEAARRDARGPPRSLRTARRSPTASGPPATPPTGSPGTPSTTPGRSRTGPSPASEGGTGPPT